MGAPAKGKKLKGNPDQCHTMGGWILSFPILKSIKLN